MAEAIKRRKNRHTKSNRIVCVFFSIGLFSVDLFYYCAIIIIIDQILKRIPFNNKIQYKYKKQET